MERYIQVGITALRDPVTGEFLPAAPVGPICRSCADELGSCLIMHKEIHKEETGMKKETVVKTMMELFRKSDDSKDRAFARMMDAFGEMVDKAKTVTGYASEEADEGIMLVVGDCLEEINTRLAELIDRYGISEGAEQVE